jgi:tetratricopeptide (TPR) repeat protein
MAAPHDATRAFEAAADLADDPDLRPRLLERAGDRARAAGRLDRSEELLRDAESLTREAGAAHDRARVSAALALTLWRLGGLDEAIELLEGAFEVLNTDDPDPDVAILAAQFGRLRHFAGNRAEAARLIEVALDMAENLLLPDVIASALTTKSLIIAHRPYESDALLRQALKVALDNDLAVEALRAYNNLCVLLSSWDREEEAYRVLPEALALAHRRGDRFWESQLMTGLVEEALFRGDWNEALVLVADIVPGRAVEDDNIHTAAARILQDRGEPDAAMQQLTRLPEDHATSDVQLRTVALWRKRLTAELEGRHADAMAAAAECLTDDSLDFLTSQIVCDAVHDTATYATLSGDHTAALALAARVETLPPMLLRARGVQSQLQRLRANAAAATGDPEGAAEAYGVALANARSLGFAYWLAPVLHDYGAWLVSTGRADEAAPLVAEARELFEHMGATVWLRRLDAIAPARATEVVA